MRSNFIIALTVVTVVLLAMVIHFRPRPSVMPENSSPSAVSVASVSLQHETVSSQPVYSIAVEPVPAALPPSAEELSQQLQEWSQDGSVQALTNILNAYTTSAEKKLRLEAVEAVRQTSRREAIPFLQDAAAKVSDLDEKMALLDVAAFLSGSTVAEQIAAPQLDEPE